MTFPQHPNQSYYYPPQSTTAAGSSGDTGNSQPIQEQPQFAIPTTPASYRFGQARQQANSRRTQIMAQQSGLNPAQRNFISASPQEEEAISRLERTVEKVKCPTNLPFDKFSNFGLDKISQSTVLQSSTMGKKIGELAKAELEKREFALQDEQEDFSVESFAREPVDLSLATLHRPLLNGLPMDFSDDALKTIKDGKYEEREIERMAEAQRLRNIECIYTGPRTIE